MYHWVMILATVGVPAKKDQTMGQYIKIEECQEALQSYKQNSKKTVGRCELRGSKKPDTVDNNQK
jgi:hypothetical protein